MTDNTTSVLVSLLVNVVLMVVARTSFCAGAIVTTRMEWQQAREQTQMGAMTTTGMTHTRVDIATKSRLR